ncbi:MAG TPA: DUF1343 domain-containing protein [Candidatus Kapabacteria bacterium]|nr:DUF1343 domain-containing protein [Candidatus Kapabacteria bacterium]
MILKKIISTFVFLFAPAFACAHVLLGADNLLLHYKELIENKRVAVVTNQTGYTSEGVRTIDAIRTTPGVTLAAVFTPEHGLSGTVQAGKNILSYFDTSLGVNVFSLYGPQRKPTEAMLKGIDVIVYDIQDIGVRSYTFISTLGLVMQAAAEHDIPVVVLDRPCPLATHVDGNVLDTTYRSFIGMYPVPYVYGMTVGEFAWMINDERMNGKPCKLMVVPMAGWKRAMAWKETGLHWIPTSPNIPFASTAAYYAAFGTIGELGIGAYEGIGTPEAFRVFALPGLDGAQFRKLFAEKRLDGVQCEPYDTDIVHPRGAVHYEGAKFTLDIDRVKDITVVGLEVLSVLVEMHAIHPPDSAHAAMFAKTCGGDYLQQILRGDPIRYISGEWQTKREQFLLRRDKYLLYQ